MLLKQRVPVQSLVETQRSHMQHGIAKRKKMGIVSAIGMVVVREGSLR